MDTSDGSQKVTSTLGRSEVFSYPWEEHRGWREESNENVGSLALFVDPTKHKNRTGTYPSPGPMMLQVNVQGQGAAQFVAGQVVTPEFVQAQGSSAAAGSNGRLQNSAVIQQPGLVVA